MFRYRTKSISHTHNIVYDSTNLNNPFQYGAFVQPADLTVVVGWEETFVLFRLDLFLCVYNQPILLFHTVRIIYYHSISWARKISFQAAFRMESYSLKKHWFNQALDGTHEKLKRQYTPRPSLETILWRTCTSLGPRRIKQEVVDFWPSLRPRRILHLVYNKTMNGIYHRRKDYILVRRSSLREDTTLLEEFALFDCHKNERDCNYNFIS